MAWMWKCLKSNWQRQSTAMQTAHENIGKFGLEVPARPQEDEDGI